jgi:DNA (cytosine-5)-methyltransferase 1
MAEKKTVASLFSGCGGMDLGFEGDFQVPRTCLSSMELASGGQLSEGHLPPLDFETIFACDVYPKAKVAWESFFRRRRADGHLVDIYKTQSVVDIVRALKDGDPQLSTLLEGVDVVTGGFPCNDFSVAGKRLGFQSNKSHRGNRTLLDVSVEDPTAENRGMLYFWMREFVGLTKPSVFVAENVRGLVSLGDAKEVIERDFASIPECPYIVVPARVIRAMEHGVPQTRERVIFMGFRKDRLKKTVLEHFQKHGDFPKELTPYPDPTHGDGEGLRRIATCRDAFEGLEEPDKSGDASQRAYSKAKYMGKGLQGQSEISLDKPGPTIRAEHHGNIEYRRLSRENGGRSDEMNDGRPERRLSVRECARIQTFPDDYEFVQPGSLSASDAYRLIGNAVPPLLGYRIASRLQDIWDQILTG